MLLFLQLCAAHLVADFLLQSRWMAQNKRKVGPLVAHALVHVVCGCVFLNVGLNGKAAIAIAALAAVHAVQDYLKARFSTDGWVALLVDQTLHVAAVGGAAVWLNPGSWPVVRDVAGGLFASPGVYLVLSAYVGVIFGGGYLVQKVTRSFLARIEAEVKPHKPGLPEAGTYIGWVERFLVLTFVIAGFNEAIGFLLAVKALARFPEIKEDTKGSFGEYFLIGSLTSVGIALVGGFAVKEVLTRL